MRRVLFMLALVSMSACRPDFDERDWLVDTVRVLAVKSEPAETKPGDPVTFNALLSGATAASGAPSWSFCSAPKPLSEDNAVSAACLGSEALRAVGRGLTIQARIPLDSCARFGPDTAPGGFRPRDPDLTGGYYQPVRVDLSGADATFHLQRVLCSLADASFETATQFGQDYEPNQNPHLAPLVARVAGEGLALDQIPSAASVDLELGWRAADAESYAYYDRAEQVLTVKREALRVAWYVNAGRLDTETTSRADDDPALTVSNRWLAPQESGTYQLWVVLRDSRGGVDFATYELSVLP